MIQSFNKTLLMKTKNRTVETDTIFRLFGLAFGCPFELVCKDCPLEDLYKLSPGERIATIKGLSKSECEDMLWKHLQNFDENFNKEPGLKF
jgi:hypothetical protein